MRLKMIFVPVGFVFVAVSAYLTGTSVTTTPGKAANTKPGMISESGNHTAFDESTNNHSDLIAIQRNKNAILRSNTSPESTGSSPHIHANEHQQTYSEFEEGRNTADRIRNGGDAAVDIAVRALESPKEQVRLHSLNEIITRSLDVPVDTIKQLAISDSSATVRAMAISAIAQNPNLALYDKESIIAAAGSDTDPIVQIVLEDLKHSVAMLSKPHETGQDALQQ